LVENEPTDQARFLCWRNPQRQSQRPQKRLPSPAPTWRIRCPAEARRNSDRRRFRDHGSAIRGSGLTDCERLSNNRPSARAECSLLHREPRIFRDISLCGAGVRHWKDVLAHGSLRVRRSLSGSEITYMDIRTATYSWPGLAHYPAAKSIMSFSWAASCVATIPGACFCPTSRKNRARARSTRFSII